MADDRDPSDGPLSDPSPAEEEAAEPGSDSAVAAETQFPYLATQGIASTTSEADEPPRFGNRPPRRRQVSIALISLLLLLLAILIAYQVIRPMASRHSGAAAADAVRGYLTALADGDAETALGYAAEPLADPTLLTDPVLAESRATAPLTAIDVVVPPDRTDVQQVRARYRLGERPVESTFDLVWQENAWRLKTVAAEVDLDGLPTVPLLLNDAAVTGPRPALFPGSYRLTTSNPRLVLVGGDFVVPGPLESPVPTATVELSDAGRAEVVKAAEEQFAACLEQRELEPDNCGFALTHPDQVTLDESTVRWSAPGADAQLADAEIVLDHPGSATAKLAITVEGDVSGQDGSHWEATDKVTRMRADLTADEITVEFG